MIYQAPHPYEVRTCWIRFEDNNRYLIYASPFPPHKDYQNRWEHAQEEIDAGVANTWEGCGNPWNPIHSFRLGKGAVSANRSVTLFRDIFVDVPENTYIKVKALHLGDYKWRIL